MIITHVSIRGELALLDTRTTYIRKLFLHVNLDEQNYVKQQGRLIDNGQGKIVCKLKHSQY